MLDSITLHRVFKSVFEPAVDPSDPGSAGRRKAADKVMAVLYNRCYGASQTHVPGDPYTSAYNAGRRAIWIWLAGVLREDPRELEQRMSKELSDD